MINKEFFSQISIEAQNRVTFKVLKYVEYLSSFNFTEQEIVEGVYQNVSKVMESEVDNISCKRGCSFCCYSLVDATKQEVEVAYQYAKEKGFALDRDLIEEQAKFSDSIETWEELPYRKRACPFLVNNECAVYEKRPAACRRLTSLDDPALCNMEQYPEQVVRRIHHEDVECLIASLYTMYVDTYSTLTRHLRDLLND